MNKAKAAFGVIGLIALLIAGAYYGLSKHGATVSKNTDAFAKTYEAHALQSPFNLLSKTQSNSTVTYFYQVNSSVEDATKEVQKQFTGGGYQNNAHHMDTKSTVYRDLITGDISVIANIAPTAAGRTGVTVSVTGIGKG
jgi:hypothetical protein